MQDLYCIIDYNQLHNLCIHIIEKKMFKEKFKLNFSFPKQSLNMPHPPLLTPTLTNLCKNNVYTYLFSGYFGLVIQLPCVSQCRLRGEEVAQKTDGPLKPMGNVTTACFTSLITD